MPNKIKCAVIGAGNMGKNHVRTYAGIENVELVGIADLNEALGQEIADEFKTRYYKDFKEMISAEKPAIVSICVPTSYHYVVAKECINLGVNILLEKPITLELKDGKELIKQAEKKGVAMMVGHIERFNPAITKVKELIDKGEIGRVITIMARRVGGFPPQIKDADIAVDLAIHDLDIVNYLLDSLPREINVNRQKNHIKGRADSVEFFLKYDKASAYIQANWITPVKIRKLNITGTEGYLELDYINQRIEFYKSNYEKFKDNYGGFSDYILRFFEPDKIDISVAKKEPLREEILAMIKLVQGKKKFDCNYAIEALKIAKAG